MDNSTINRLRQDIKFQCAMNLVRSGGIMPHVDNNARNQIQQALLEDYLIDGEKKPNLIDRLTDYCVQKKESMQETRPEDIIEEDI